MTFRYFAYGSNLWSAQMSNRCPSRRLLEVAHLDGWAARYAKPSLDGSAKVSIFEVPGSSVEGVVWEIDDADWDALVASEPGYVTREVMVGTRDGDTHTAWTFAWPGPTTDLLPYDWYVATVVAGAREQGLDEQYVERALERESIPDPLAPGIRPAGPSDLPTMQTVLGASLAAADHHTLHPGELAWWIHHHDPRRPMPTCWLQGEDGLLVLDEPTGEINVFTRSGRDRWPLVTWAQRRLGGKGMVEGVSSHDPELVAILVDQGYRKMKSDHTYEWDLTSKPIPEPEPPDGFVLRALRGEEEADARRRAAHAAFESTMDHSMHLERYLRFMRSGVYEPERDLVVEAPDGSIASFMIWWPDPSGIAQIEPFGTDPRFQRLGLGRALAHFGLGRLKDFGMTVCRVNTDDFREATAFYPAVGFTETGTVDWWASPERLSRPGP